MKALSLSQPWCWAILYAGKHVENRSWQPPIEMIDQQIALHAAKSFDDKRGYHGMTPTGFLLSHGFINMPQRKRSFQNSAIVGVATIDRIVTKPDSLPDNQKRWFFGEYGWVLTNVICLPDPIPCRGFQGLWGLPADVETAIADAIMEVA